MEQRREEKRPESCGGERSTRVRGCGFLEKGVRGCRLCKVTISVRAENQGCKPLWELRAGSESWVCPWRWKVARCGVGGK